MLGKQERKFIIQPDALVKKFFKAKLLSFLNAQIGHNPSYSWRILWPTRALLNEGGRWTIGKESNNPI